MAAKTTIKTWTQARRGVVKGTYLKSAETVAKGLDGGIDGRVHHIPNLVKSSASRHSQGALRGVATTLPLSVIAVLQCAASASGV